ncbi:MAG: hypothetical protein J6A17_01840 [Bacilli bacterium]|nr:hypothetical protein [Bacilli bacterium]
MKKMFYFVFAFVATLLFVPSVYALDPEYNLQMGTDNKEVFLANGNAITVTADPDNAEGAIITWEGGSQKVTKAVTIFGGAHNDATELATTSITMNGGKVKNIFGGGLHKSGVGTSNISINGGQVTGSIMGGGYHGFLTDADYTAELASLTASDAPTSPVYVKEAYITVNGGNLDGVMIFGGGGGYSRTDIANIEINNHTGTIAYLIGGGSNGYTGKAYVTLNEGSVDVMQSVNRGSMDSTLLVVNGGEVENLYVVAEEDPLALVGVVTAASVVVEGGLVTNLETGVSGGLDGSNNTNAVPTEGVYVTYNEDTVTNIDETTFPEDAVTETVTLTLVTFDGTETVEVPKGSVWDEEELIEELNADLKDLGYEVEGIYADEDYTKAYDFSVALDADTTMYINLVEIVNASNPATADAGVTAAIVFAALAILGLGFALRKRCFN